ncbi:hypothetical protein OIV83_002900 [Microbotryomycetes sp. JL201]|nr:hypothetical protein OIV83_002900 [Microbotryomycetes sp. JL201]
MDWIGIGIEYQYGGRNGGYSDGGYWNSPQGREDQMRDSIERAESHRRRAEENRQHDNQKQRDQEERRARERAEDARRKQAEEQERQRKSSAAAEATRRAAEERERAERLRQEQEREQERLRAEENERAALGNRYRAAISEQSSRIAAVTESEFTDYKLEREKACGFAHVLIEAAKYATLSATTTALDHLGTARQLIDLALDFTPGLSLAKDIASLARMQNVITGEALGDVEAGLMAACILVPGALKGAAVGTGQALHALRAAQEGAGIGAHLAKAFEYPVNEACKWLGRLGDGTDVVNYAPEATKRLARALEYTGDVVERSFTAAEKRGSKGIATISNELFDSPALVRGTHANAGLVPLEIGQRLEGRQFSSFDAFRRAFWTEVANSKYAHDLGPLSLHDMQKGLAPLAREAQHHGGRRTFELHHMTPIHDGGNVYDLSNIAIVTPRYHVDVLDRAYHFAK